jgi:hypothetical protein
MRTTAILALVTMLLGGCAGYAPPEPQTRIDAPRPAAEPVATRQAPARPVTQPPRAAAAIKLDNTSLASFRASWERLYKSLSPAQRADLNDAIVQLTFAEYGGAAHMPANLRASPIVPEMIRHQIAGLTYAEIIALSQ